MIPLGDDNPTFSAPIVSRSLIVVCVITFFWVSIQPNARSFTYALGLIPANLLTHWQLPNELRWVPPGVTVFSSMFLHGGFMHLAGNMLYLWIFGDNIEDRIGHVRFVAFYFICGIAAAMAQALPNPSSAIPMIGASGAISGVLGAYLVLFPSARILVLIPLGIFSRTVHLPAVLVLGFWFVMQLLQSASTGAGGSGVAFGAHIGGFIAGMLLILLFDRRPRRRRI